MQQLQTKGAPLLALVRPHAERAHAAAMEIERKYCVASNCWLWKEAAFGLVLVFEGYRVLTIVAVIEAVNLVGVENIMKHFTKLLHAYRIAREAVMEESRKDGSRDIPDGWVEAVAPKDATSKAPPTPPANETKAHETPKHPDAKGVIEKVKAMMTAAKLLAQDNRHHAMGLAALKVTKLEDVAASIFALYSMALAIYATATNWLAASITLGTSLGVMLFPIVLRKASPWFKKGLPEEMHKDIPSYARLLCQSGGIIIAIQLRKTVATIQCACRGAQIFIIHAQASAVTAGYLQKPVMPETSPLFVMAVNALAVWGILSPYI